MAVDVVVYDKVDKESEKIQDALYALYPQATITDAAIASFADGSDGIPVKELVVNVEPAQDLHGYDNPWPAGAGKNLFDSSVFPASAAQSISYIHYKVQNGTYTMSTPDFPLVGGVTNVYFLAGAVSSGASSGSNGVSQSTPITITVTDGYYTVAYRSTNDTNTNNPKNFKWQIESGNSATSYSPYSNICPISGWTGAEIEGTGKNLLTLADQTLDSGTINVSRGIVTANNTYATNKSVKIGTFKPAANGSYILSGSVSGSSTTYQLRLYNAAGTTVIARSVSGDSDAVLLTAGTGYGVWVFFFGGFTANDIKFYPMIRVASDSDATFEPYSVKEISVTFPSAAGTVYGGTLTINPDRTGALVVDRAMVDLSTLGYSYDGNRWQTTSLASLIKNFASRSEDIVSDRWDADITAQAGDEGKMITVNGALFFYTSDSANKPTGQLVYPLATPNTYTLTPEEVSGILTTLYGTNNIWADCGSIQKITYRADLGKYIDSHITTAVANALNA